MRGWADGRRAYRLGAAVAVVTSLLTIWTTIVRDDGRGIGFFMLVMAAMVGTASAWFRPAGMARTMFGVAIMQAALGALMATAPSTVTMPGGAFKIALSSSLFMTLWLISAAFFRAATKTDLEAAATFR